MDSSVSPKDEIWFLRLCHHISTGLYLNVRGFRRRSTLALGTYCPDSCHSLRSGHSTILPALNLQPAATPEPDGLCGNQRYRRELLMMGIMVPETF